MILKTDPRESSVEIRKGFLQPQQSGKKDLLMELHVKEVITTFAKEVT